MILPGFYGKLPTAGDFVTRRLPPDFVRSWDRWCARHLGSGPAPPAGRRAACASHLPGQATGLALPSRDRSGRAFPLTLAAPAPRQPEGVVRRSRPPRPRGGGRAHRPRRPGRRPPSPAGAAGGGGHRALPARSSGAPAAARSRSTSPVPPSWRSSSRRRQARHVVAEQLHALQGRARLGARHGRARGLARRRARPLPDRRGRRSPPRRARASSRT